MKRTLIAVAIVVLALTVIAMQVPEGGTARRPPTGGFIPTKPVMATVVSGYPAPPGEPTLAPAYPPPPSMAAPPTPEVTMPLIEEVTREAGAHETTRKP